MKHNCKTIQPHLLEYAETVRLQKSDIPSDWRGMIEEHLSQCELCQNEVNEITQHLLYLQQIPQVEPSAQLANCCLQIEQTAKPLLRSQTFVQTLVACSLMLFFAFGVWIGSSRHAPSSTPDPFFALLEEQNILLEQFENLVQKKMENPDQADAHIYMLRASTDLITQTYQSNQSDYVVQRGLSLAISQNIEVLESLCTYLEHSKSIPELDFQQFQMQPNLSKEI